METGTLVMVEVSFFFDADIVEIRRKAAPFARWRAESKAWMMTSDMAQYFEEAVKAHAEKVGKPYMIKVDGVPRLVHQFAGTGERRILEQIHYNHNVTATVWLSADGSHRYIEVAPADRDIPLSLATRRTLNDTQYMGPNPLGDWAGNRRALPELEKRLGLFSGVVS